jgi:hypothetical protein
MPAIWHIYYVKNCRHAIPVPKDKLVVIVCVSIKPRGFLINTRIHPFIQNRADLLVCQAAIEAANHKCLDYDSYVDCKDLYPFEDDELLDVRDPVSSQARTEIKKAVAASKTIEPCYKKII